MVIGAVGAVLGFVSLLAGLASAACCTSRCNTGFGTGWLVLMAAQALTYPTALLGAATARRPGQLARAALLGIAGPNAAAWAGKISR